jgi:hypothetical protein
MKNYLKNYLKNKIQKRMKIFKESKKSKTK